MTVITSLHFPSTLVILSSGSLALFCSISVQSRLIDLRYLPRLSRIRFSVWLVGGYANIFVLKKGVYPSLSRTIKRHRQHR